jgi:hypothetical protein
VGDRKDAGVIKDTLGGEKFDAVYDMNAREVC